MRITIDALPLLFRSAGVKNYLYYWIRHLQREPGADLRLFPFLEGPAGLDHEVASASLGGTVSRLGLFHLINRLPAEFGQLFLPSAGVFHASKVIHPPRRAKLTATIYDLTCWLVPETHRPGVVALDHLFAERIWQRADGLIAISENSRNDAARLLRIPEERICVIYPGVPKEYSSVSQESVVAVRHKHGLERPYLLYVGTIEPRKNVALLLDAYNGISPSVADEFALVVAGPRGWPGPELLARLESPPKNVRYLGYVPEDELPALFAGATAFVYPSLYEGFGFPVAQAMAAGIPVITSGVSSLPEVTGGVALLIDPRSLAELRGAIERILTAPSLRARMSAEGRTQAERFSWADNARKSMEFFSRTVSGWRDAVGAAH
jgi:glycosyltransferase involved in cell wall biosynthesis